MARACATCTHPLRAEIDAQLTATNRYTGGLRALASRYGLSLNGLSRHQQNHPRAVTPPAPPVFRSRTVEQTLEALATGRLTRQQIEEAVLALAGWRRWGGLTTWTRPFGFPPSGPTVTDPSAPAQDLSRREAAWRRDVQAATAGELAEVWGQLWSRQPPARYRRYAPPGAPRVQDLRFSNGPDAGATATQDLRETERTEPVQAQAVQTPPLPTTEGGFQLAVVDPPWPYETRSPKGQGKSPSQHYATMTLDELKALPLPAVMASDSELALWTTGPNLLQSGEVLEAWGYRYSTVLLDWEKLTVNGKPAVTQSHSTLPNHEYLLRARRGKGLPRRARNVRQDLKAAVGAHSEKPAESFARLERFYGPDVRRLDAFSRTDRPGWTAWGLEAGKLNVNPRTLPLPLLPDSDQAAAG